MLVRNRICFVLAEIIQNVTFSVVIIFNGSSNILIFNCISIKSFFFMQDLCPKFWGPLSVADRQILIWTSFGSFAYPARLWRKGKHHLKTFTNNIFKKKNHRFDLTLIAGDFSDADGRQVRKVIKLEIKRRIPCIAEATI